jgi:hypothetical protein
MAIATYALLAATALPLTRLGLGALSATQAAVFLGSAIGINATFYVLIRTGLNLRFADPSMTGAQIVASALWGTLALYALPRARPIVLMLFLPAFAFGILRFDRRRYFGLVAIILGIYAALLAVEAALGRPGFRLEYEALLFVIFGVALSWFAYFGGFVSSLRRRLVAQRLDIARANEELRREIERRSLTAQENLRLIAELRESLANVKTLSGLLPICASCKKIRDDAGYWNQIEGYLRSHSDAEFTHGLCPDCAEKYFPPLPAAGSEG